MPQNSPVITLPDGSKREFDKPVSVLAVAEDIGPGLAKATLAAFDALVAGLRPEADRVRELWLL